jgi:ABC-2 type transport system ATP-binding protein
VPPAISVRGVSKRFWLSHERYQTLKERAIHFGRVPREEFWALRDIDLDVEEGATAGLLGANGSGKSTLLKCVAGILRPTSGEIVTRGRVAALLELGAGFQAELTGRENIFLNGAILGMSRRELAQRFDEIVGFAELEQFIDMQVRFYSSGMYVRLGFAIAVNVEPDILLVDEVLAVGDEAFQRKCLDRVGEFQRDGRTIVVVTHAADLARKICQTVAVLDHGTMVASGEPREAVQVFREHLRRTAPRRRPGEPPAVDDRMRVTAVVFDHPGTSEKEYVVPGEPLEVRVQYEADAAVDDPVFTIMVYDGDGRMLLSSSTASEEVETGRIDGPGEVVFSFDEVHFHDGEYAVTACITSNDGDFIYDWQEQRYRFEVKDPKRAFTSVDTPVRVTIHKRRLPREAAG